MLFINIFLWVQKRNPFLDQTFGCWDSFVKEKNFESRNPSLYIIGWGCGTQSFLNGVRLGRNSISLEPFDPQSRALAFWKLENEQESMKKEANFCSGWFFFFSIETPINVIHDGYINRKRKRYHPEQELVSFFNFFSGWFFFSSIETPINVIHDGYINRKRKEKITQNKSWLPFSTSVHGDFSFLLLKHQSM